jgi:membrane protease YdiL (CAAX protease family)
MLPMSTSTTSVLMTGLVAILAGVFPVWDYFYIKRWRLSTDPEKRIRLYRLTIVWLWSATLCAAFLLPPHALFYAPPYNSAWFNSMFPRSTVVGLVVGGVGGLLTSVIMYRRALKTNSRAGRKLQHKLAKIKIYLPQSARERQWFAAVCLSAGFCEELLYRGVLLHYALVFPWQLKVWAGLLAASGIFGLGHVYQGLTGIPQTAAVGLLLGVLFLATGSLLAPMVLHTLIDLRILMLLPKAMESGVPIETALG